MVENWKFIEVASLSTGASFGEMALIKNKPRAAKIKCLEYSEFAILNRSNYNSILKKIEELEIKSKIRFL